MDLLNYWERLLIMGISNENHKKDCRDYYNHCFGVINVGLGP